MSRLNQDIAEIISCRKLFDVFAGKTVLVTGATGLIGSMLIKSLYAANQAYHLSVSVLGMIRNEEKAERLFGSLYTEPGISFVKEYNGPCDYIIHTAAPTASKFFVQNPVETIQTSVLGTMGMLELAKKNNATMLYLSSMEEYGVPYSPGEVMTEEKIGILDHLNVRSSYSESKRLCECLCVSYSSEYAVDIKIARLAQTFGAGIAASDNRMPIQFGRAVMENRSIVLHTEGKSLSNFVYLTDAVTALLTIINNGTGGEAYNVCNDRETRSVREIAELVADEVADGAIRVEIEIKEGMGYKPDDTMYLSSKKLENLGWCAGVSTVEAYKRLVEYLQEMTE